MPGKTEFVTNRAEYAAIDCTYWSGLTLNDDDDDDVFYAEGARSAPGLPRGMRRARVYLAIPVTRLYEAGVLQGG